MRINQGFVVTGKLDNMQAQHLFIRDIGNQFAYRVPDDVFTRQIEYFGVDGFYRQCARFHHHRRVTQRRIKRIVLNVNQLSDFGQWRDIKAGFGDKRQRTFRAGKNAG